MILGPVKRRIAYKRTSRGCAIYEIGHGNCKALFSWILACAVRRKALWDADTVSASDEAARLKVTWEKLWRTLVSNFDADSGIYGQKKRLMRSQDIESLILTAVHESLDSWMPV